jgi:nucleotide-binding universal stress UspA family protein
MTGGRPVRALSEGIEVLVVRKLMVPTDFSAAAALALRYGQEVAGLFGAALYVVHVADDPTMYAPTTSEKFRAQFLEDADGRLADWLRSVAGEVEQVRLRTFCGSAGDTLVEFAHAEGIDLVVMGSHGHSPLVSMLLGSVAEHVVRHSPCPVLTVRWPQHERHVAGRAEERGERREERGERAEDG